MNDQQEIIGRLRDLRRQLNLVIESIESGAIKWFDIKIEQPHNVMEIGEYAIVGRGEYHDLVRRANRTREEVIKDAHLWSEQIAERLKRFTKPIDPKSLASFLESRTDYLDQLE